MDGMKWRVRELAERRGWNISQLAEKAGIAYSSALDLWHGRPQRIDLPTLRKVIDALDALPSDVLERAGEHAA